MFERRIFSRTAAAAAIAGLAAVAPAKAEDTVKVGMILPMTGGQASTGKGGVTAASSRTPLRIRCT